MVSITLSIPVEVKACMDKFGEMNWSGFVRKALVEKTKELSWKEELLAKLKNEEQLHTWAVEAQRTARKGRFAQLQRRGLV